MSMPGSDNLELRMRTSSAQCHSIRGVGGSGMKHRKPEFSVTYVFTQQQWNGLGRVKGSRVALISVRGGSSYMHA